MRNNAPRFVFSGHAIGAAAQFHKLDETPVHHAIPALGASVLPPTGGVSRAEVNNFCYEAAHPRRRSLLSVHRIQTSAVGRVCGQRFETETEANIESITVAGKLHIDYVRVHVLAVREDMEADPTTSSDGNRIKGVHLDHVTADIELDDEAMSHCGSGHQMSQFLDRRGLEAPQDGICTYSLVRKIDLNGPDDELKLIEKDGNAIYWKGFGWMFFGEVIVKAHDRQVTMVRLQMGSDAGGSGTVGDGQSNGQVVRG